MLSIPPSYSSSAAAHMELQRLGEGEKCRTLPPAVFSLSKVQLDLGTQGPWVVAMRGCSLHSYYCGFG